MLEVIDGLSKILELSYGKIVGMIKILFTYYFTKQITGDELSANINDTTIHFVLYMVLFYILFYGVIQFILFTLLKKTSNFRFDNEFVKRLFQNNKMKNYIRWIVDIFDAEPSDFARGQTESMKSASEALCSLSVIFIQLFSCTFEYKFLYIAILLLVISYICFINLTIYKNRENIILEIIDENY